MKHYTIISIVVIVLLLGTSAVSVANPHLLQISESLSQNDSFFKTTSAGASLNYQQLSFQASMSLVQNSGTPDQWTQNPNGAYSISVPANSGALFTEGTIATVNFQAEYEVNNIIGDAYQAITLTVPVTGKIIFTPYNSHGVAATPVVYPDITTNLYIPTSTSGWGGVVSYSFPTSQYGNNFPWNFNQTNQWHSMNGIAQFILYFSVPTLTYGGSVLSGYNSNVYAEQYVFPGTGTLNAPNSVVLGNSTSITGTIMNGNYNLLITGPNNDQTKINLGSYNSGTSDQPKTFNVSFKPTVLGKYTVTLTNTVVGLVETQFFSASALIPTPTIVVTTPSNSGYYSEGQTINYTVSLVYNTTLPVQFQLYIWDGALGYEPLYSNTALWIEQNIFVDPTYNSTSHTFTYNGQITASSNSQTEGAISFLVNGYYQSGTHLLISKAPGKLQISVGKQTTTQQLPSFNWYNLGIATAVVLGVVAYAWKTPEEMIVKFGLLGSALVFLMTIGLGVI